MVENHPSSPEVQMRIHQFGKKVLPGVFLGYERIAGGIWKGDILIADLEDVEMMDASDIDPRRIKAKQVMISQKDDEFGFPNSFSHLQMVQQNCQEETTNSECPL